MTEPSTFADWLTKLHTDKHTGPVVFHFAEGSPNAVEVPRKPERIKLDKGVKQAHALRTR